MDPFKQAGDFYSRAFASQGAAAAEQAYSQKGMDKEDAYKTELYENPYGSPIPPKTGPYGVFKEAGETDSEFVEDMKQELLAKSSAMRRGTNGAPAVRASGGMPTRSLG